MSTLVIEVCTVESIEPHPNADLLAIATIKGWKTCVKYNPVSKEADFKPGDKCVYFPPDSVLTQEVAEKFNVTKYLKQLPKDSGIEGGRVAATRLRGFPSYGMIVHLDDPDWEVGKDVKEHYGVTKWEPPPESLDGDAETPNLRFHAYTNMEHFANFPNAFTNGEEIIITEKIHGKNCRVGLILDADENGNAIWIEAAGSHGMRRKQFCNHTRRFDIVEIIEKKIIKRKDVKIGTFFKDDDGYFWKIINIQDESVEPQGAVRKFWLWIKKKLKLDRPEGKFIAEKYTKDGAEDGDEFVLVLRESEFWQALNANVRSLLKHIQNEYDVNKPKHGIVVFGEIYGSGVQDMTYNLQNGQRGFRAFDIAVNGRYIDHDVKTELFEKFGVEQVPILYQGPFSKEIVETQTNGKTTLCDPKKAGKFSGREGVVVVPAKERYSGFTNGRLILKSVSADYLARRDGTDSH